MTENPYIHEYHVCLADMFRQTAKKAENAKCNCEIFKTAFIPHILKVNLRLYMLQYLLSISANVLDLKKIHKLFHA